MSDSPTALRFLGDRPRLKTVMLEWPIAYGDKTYAEIGVLRLTAGQVAAFQEAAATLPDGAAPVWPIYADSDGQPVPLAVLDGLDDDDRFELDKAVRDFLPRRFHGALASASAPATGASTGSP